MSESTAPRVGPAWGDNITKKRQRELDGYLAAWDADADHGARKSPFDGPPDESFDRRLTGADVFYLAARSLVGTKQDYPVFEVLDEASDEDVDEYTISNIDEARTLLREPGGAFGLKLTGLNLQGANLIGAQLAGAYLVEARLDHTILGAANLEGAYLRDARLAEADLRSADLEGTHLEGAQLTGADLGGARLDRDTRLNDASLVGIFVDQIALDNTNLNVLSWEGVAPLGEEVEARAAKDESGERKSRKDRIEDYEAAVRANRLLATEMRRQGLAENADVFAYRAQIMQRKLNFRRRRLGRWLVSWGLATMAGYGYRLWRIFFVYGLVLAVFAAIFWALGVHSYGAEPWYQALWDSFLVSLSAIHGRAVFEQLGAWTPAAWVAAIESVVGIVIEGVFVAMLIQRLFR